jgi:polyhydroxyalkanoate synthesis regulator phasin
MKKAKSKTVYFGVRLDADLVDEIRERARKNERKIGAEMGRILRAALAGAGSLSEAELYDAKRDRYRVKYLERLVKKLEKQKNAEGGRA